MHFIFYLFWVLRGCFRQPDPPPSPPHTPVTGWRGWGGLPFFLPGVLFFQSHPTPPRPRNLPSPNQIWTHKVPANVLDFIFRRGSKPRFAQKNALNQVRGRTVIRFPGLARKIKAPGNPTRVGGRERRLNQGKGTRSACANGTVRP